MPGRRECGSCSLCCKLLVVPELGKAGGVWCGRFSKGRGCTAYEERPESCRVFSCAWLRGGVGEHWRPDRSRMVIGFREDEGRKVMEISVDPGCRNYELEPWRSDIERFLGEGRYGVEILVQGKRLRVEHV